jgi:hypothetical protein
MGDISFMKIFDDMIMNNEKNKNMIKDSYWSLQTGFRMLFTLILLFFVYNNASFWVTLCFFLLFIGTEAQAYLNLRNKNSILELQNRVRELRLRDAITSTMVKELKKERD